MGTREISALLALLAAGCFSGYSSDGPGLSRLRVHRGPFTREIVLTGELEAARGEAITVPQLPSWQTSIKWIAADGSEVKQGDRVVELDSTAFASNLDGKRQTVVQAEQQLTQKKAEWSADIEQKELDLAKKRVDYDKARLDVAVPEEIVSRRELQDREVKFKRAEVELAKATDVLRSQRRAVTSDRANLEITLQKAQRELHEAETAIAALTLRAPRAGIVVVRDIPWEGRKLQEGDAVFVGFPLALIPEPTSMQVDVALADVDDRKIAVGMPATVILDAYPDLRFPGRIADVSAVARENAVARASLRRSFRVLVELQRIDFARMRPGLSARVIVRRDSQPAALLASRAGLDLRNAQARARLAGGRSVPVTLGACNAQECVVLSGLLEGDTLSPVRRSEDGNE
jgi:HlyD family secretion protein